MINTTHPDAVLTIRRTVELSLLAVEESEVAAMFPGAREVQILGWELAMPLRILLGDAGAGGPAPCDAAFTHAVQSNLASLLGVSLDALNVTCTSVQSAQSSSPSARRALRTYGAAASVCTSSASPTTSMGVTLSASTSGSGSSSAAGSSLKDDSIGAVQSTAASTPGVLVCPPSEDAVAVMTQVRATYDVPLSSVGALAFRAACSAGGAASGNAAAAELAAALGASGTECSFAALSGDSAAQTSGSGGSGSGKSAAMSTSTIVVVAAAATTAVAATVTAMAAFVIVRRRRRREDRQHAVDEALARDQPSYVDLPAALMPPPAAAQMRRSSGGTGGSAAFERHMALVTAMSRRGSGAPGGARLGRGAVAAEPRASDCGLPGAPQAAMGGEAGRDRGGGVYVRSRSETLPSSRGRALALFGNSPSLHHPGNQPAIIPRYVRLTLGATRFRPAGVSRRVMAASKAGTSAPTAAREGVRSADGTPAGGDGAAAAAEGPVSAGAASAAEGGLWARSQSMRDDSGPSSAEDASRTAASMPLPSISGRAAALALLMRHRPGPSRLTPVNATHSPLARRSMQRSQERARVGMGGPLPDEPPVPDVGFSTSRLLLAALDGVAADEEDVGGAPTPLRPQSDLGLVEDGSDSSGDGSSGVGSGPRSAGRTHSWRRLAARPVGQQRPSAPPRQLRGVRPGGGAGGGSGGSLDGLSATAAAAARRQSRRHSGLHCVLPLMVLQPPPPPSPAPSIAGASGAGSPAGSLAADPLSATLAHLRASAAARRASLPMAARLALAQAAAGGASRSDGGAPAAYRLPAPPDCMVESSAARRYARASARRATAQRREAEAAGAAAATAWPRPAGSRAELLQAEDAGLASNSDASETAKDATAAAATAAPAALAAAAVLGRVASAGRPPSGGGSRAGCGSTSPAAADGDYELVAPLAVEPGPLMVEQPVLRMAARPASPPFGARTPFPPAVEQASGEAAEARLEAAVPSDGAEPPSMELPMHQLDRNELSQDDIHQPKQCTYELQQQQDKHQQEAEEHEHLQEGTEQEQEPLPAGVSDVDTDTDTDSKRTEPGAEGEARPRREHIHGRSWKLLLPPLERAFKSHQSSVDGDRSEPGSARGPQSPDHSVHSRPATAATGRSRPGVAFSEQRAHGLQVSPQAVSPPALQEPADSSDDVTEF